MVRNRNLSRLAVGDLVRLKGPPCGWTNGMGGFWVGDLALVKEVDADGDITITSWKQEDPDYCPYIERRDVEKVDVQER